MVKIDLHTHSLASPDGSIDLAGYKNADLDVIAVTDHDTIDFAHLAQKTLSANKIIVGEEITTKDGEIIGLFLTEAVPAGLSATETVQQIKDQGGLVYIPHPFETVRKGVTIDTLNQVADDVDIIEAPNGRSLQRKDDVAVGWAREHGVAVCGSSDAHRAGALGKTYTQIDGAADAKNLVSSLNNATIMHKRPSLLDLLAPKWNRLRKKLR